MNKLSNLSNKIKLLSFVVSSLVSTSIISVLSLSVFGVTAISETVGTGDISQPESCVIETSSDNIKINVDKKNIGILEKKPEMFYAISDIWRDSFNYTYGRELISGSYINNYINNIFLKYDTFVYMHENKCISMLTLIPTQLQTSDGILKKGYYVYAVGTKKEYRNNGITTIMLDYVDEYAKSNGYDFRVLNPDDTTPWLYNFYQKRGYEFTHFRRIAMTTDEIKKASEGAESLVYQDGLSSKDLFNCRKNNLENKTGFIQWAEEELAAVQSDYKLAYKNYHELYFGDWQYAIVRFGKPNSKQIIVKEFYIKDENKRAFFKTLYTLFPDKTIIFDLPNSDEFSKFFDEFNKSYYLDILSMFNIKESNDMRDKMNYPVYFNFGID